MLCDEQWSDKQGYELLKDLKRMHKNKVKRAEKAPVHVVKLLGPGDLPSAVHSAFYKDEPPVATGTVSMSQSATGNCASAARLMHWHSWTCPGSKVLTPWQRP